MHKAMCILLYSRVLRVVLVVSRCWLSVAASLEAWRRGAGRVPSLMTAAVESEASESSFFSLSLARRPWGFFWLFMLYVYSILVSQTWSNR